MNTENLTFSEKLRTTMQDLGLNQARLCEITGRSKGAVCQYLSGKRVPTEEIRKDMAISLGLDPEYFLPQQEKKAAIPTRKNVEVATIPRLDVETAARMLGINHETVRKGLQQGVFPWGYGIRTSANRWVYFINAKRFAEIEGIAI